MLSVFPKAQDNVLNVFFVKDIQSIVKEKKGNQKILPFMKLESENSYLITLLKPINGL